MEIKHNLTEREISDFFMQDPKLAYLGLSDDTLVYMYNNKKYQVKPNTMYAGIYQEGKLIAIFRWELYTAVTISLHLYVSSILHSSGILYKIKEEMYNFFKKSSSFVKVLVPVPSTCTHVIKAAEKMGFIHEATIKECVTWRQELVDVLYYSMKLK